MFKVIFVHYNRKKLDNAYYETRTAETLDEAVQVMRSGNSCQELNGRWIVVDLEGKAVAI